jgi:hypothetical protein
MKCPTCHTSGLQQRAWVDPTDTERIVKVEWWCFNQHRWITNQVFKSGTLVTISTEMIEEETEKQVL